MIKGNFVLIGTKESGKTSFLRSIFSQNSASIKFKICSFDPPNITTPYYQMCNFNFMYNSYVISNLNISDYDGSIFNECDSNNSVKERVRNDIYNADVMYIMLDGNYFMDGDVKSKCRNIKRNYTRFVTPYISGYSAENDGKLPTTIFIITKGKKVLEKNSKYELINILRKSFSSLFDYEDTGYDEPCAVCIDSGADRYAVNIPFFIGIYYLFLMSSLNNKEKNTVKNLLEENLRKYQYFIVSMDKKLSLHIGAPDRHTVKYPKNNIFTKLGAILKKFTRG